MPITATEVLRDKLHSEAVQSIDPKMLNHTNILSHLIASRDFDQVNNFGLARIEVLHKSHPHEVHWGLEFDPKTDYLVSAASDFYIWWHNPSNLTKLGY